MKNFWKKFITFAMVFMLVFELIPTSNLKAEELNTDIRISGGNFDAWSTASGLWIGHNGDYEERLAVEAVESYEGKSAFAHVTINHKADGSSANFAANSEDMFYSSHATYGASKDEVEALIKAGYSKVLVDYYLKGDGDVKLWASYEGNYNGSWDRYLDITAEKDKWATFELKLSDVLIQLDSSTNSGYMFRVEPQAAGKYELWIGKGIAVKEGGELPEDPTTGAPVSPTDARLHGIAFEAWSGNSGLWMDGSEQFKDRLAVEAVSEYEGQKAIWHATINHKADGSSDLFKDGSEDMFYTSYTLLGVSKEEVQKWIEDGYNKLRVNYYFKGDKDLTIFANYEGVVKNESWARYIDVNATKNAWSSFDIDLNDIMYKYDDDTKIAEALKPLFRLLPTEQGTYDFWLGTAEAVKVKEEVTTEAPTTEAPTVAPTTEAPTTKKQDVKPTTTVKPTTAAKLKAPAKVKKVKLTAKKKSLKISWGKISGVKKYEIQICTTRKFKKSVIKKSTTKTTYTVKKLKAKKKYYVRVRAVKVSGKKSAAGKWSTVINKKTK